MNLDMLPLQQNLALKRFFTRRGFDLEAVMEFTPLDLDLENRRLQSLVDFMEEYECYGSRDVMEAVKGEWQFPPIFPQISPENDWYRFELWLLNEPVRKSLSEMITDKNPFRKAEDFGDKEIEAELERLLAAIEAANIGIGLNEGLPPRLLYTYLHERLGDIFEVSNGGWVIDGCSGYCPGCIQRPWCDSGQDCCWDEDEAAGKIHFTAELDPYISAEPHSLEQMRKIQAEQDAEMAKFMKEHSKPDEDWLAKQN